MEYIKYNNNGVRTHNIYVGADSYQDLNEAIKNGI